VRTPRPLIPCRGRRRSDAVTVLIESSVAGAAVYGENPGARRGGAKIPHPLRKSRPIFQAIRPGESAWFGGGRAVGRGIGSNPVPEVRFKGFCLVVRSCGTAEERPIGGGVFAGITRAFGSRCLASHGIRGRGPPGPGDRRRGAVARLVCARPTPADAWDQILDLFAFTVAARMAGDDLRWDAESAGLGAPRNTSRLSCRAGRASRSTRMLSGEREKLLRMGRQSFWGAR
jgi:hypothetical protein